MVHEYCYKCGTKLELKEIEHEGLIPYCSKCNKFIFPTFNSAVSLIVIHKDKILLIKQYGKDANILVAGYINYKENAEEAVYRELKEEMNLVPSKIVFNKTEFYEPSDTLMHNYICYVDDISNLKTDYEIDSYEWYSYKDAYLNIYTL